MISVWGYTFLSITIVSLISFVGTLLFNFSKKLQSLILTIMIGFAVGAMLGDTFIHLLPEAIHEGFTLPISFAVIAGILMFFVIEKFIHWTHCHQPGEHVHPRPYAWMNLIGDAVHNFIDGMLIAGSFMAGVPVGIATSIAVIAHEIPQEMGDYAVLVHGGFTKKQASFFNFITALTAFAGAFIVLVLGNTIPIISKYLVPFTAGGFIYIAAVDLIPEIHKETKPIISVAQFFSIVIGIAIMTALLYFS